MKAVAIIPAAGMGTRMRTTSPKQFLSLAGVPILVHTLRKFSRCTSIGMAIVPMRKSDIARSSRCLKGRLARIRATGAGRHSPAGFGLQRFSGSGSSRQTSSLCTMRCGRSSKSNRLTPPSRKRYASGAAILAIPCTDTIKQIDKTHVVTTLPRDKIVLVQTPQAFRYSLLKEGFERAQAENFYATDESCLVERLGHALPCCAVAKPISKSPSPLTCPWPNC